MNPSHVPPALQPEPSADHSLRLSALLLILVLAGALLGCATKPPPALPVSAEWRWDEHGWHYDPVLRIKAAPLPQPRIHLELREIPAEEITPEDEPPPVPGRVPMIARR